MATNLRQDVSSALSTARGLSTRMELLEKAMEDFGKSPNNAHENLKKVAEGCRDLYKFITGEELNVSKG